MELNSVELALAAVLIALLVVVLTLSQSLSALKDRVTRVERAVGPQAPSGPSGLSPEIEQEVRGLLDARKKIAAIKLVREQTGLGLKEAKDLVERF